MPAFTALQSVTLIESTQNSDLLLATTENNLVQVLDSRAQRRIRSLQAHQQSVNVCRFWDGNTFVTGRAWWYSALFLLVCCAVVMVTTLVLVVVTGSDDCTAKQWDTRMWKCVNHFKGHIGWIKNVEIYDNVRPTLCVRVCDCLQVSTAMYISAH